VSNIMFLKGIHTLDELCLDGERDVSDLRPLTGLSLTKLSLSKTGVRDLSPLRGMRLQQLRMDKTAVSNISALAGMPLQSLDISYTRVSSLAPLRGMPLKDLRLSGTPVGDISILAGMPIETLMIEDTPVLDISPVAALPLVHLHLSPANIERGLCDLRQVKSLETVATGYMGSDLWLPDELWRKYCGAPENVTNEMGSVTNPPAARDK